LRGIENQRFIISASFSSYSSAEPLEDTMENLLDTPKPGIFINTRRHPDERKINIRADGGERTRGGYAFSVRPEVEGKEMRVIVRFEEPDFSMMTATVMTHPTMDIDIIIAEDITSVSVIFDGLLLAHFHL
jgi:hypothetical protein